MRMTWQNFWMKQKREGNGRINRSDPGNHTGDYTSSRGGNRSEERRESGMNVKGLAAIVVAGILGFAGIAVYKKHGRKKDEDYVSEQLEFSDGPYVNEEDDEKEE